MFWRQPEPPTAKAFVQQRFERSIKPLLEYTDSSVEATILAFLKTLLTDARHEIDGNFQDYAHKLIPPKLDQLKGQLKGVGSVGDEVALREALYRFALEARSYRLGDS